MPFTEAEKTDIRRLCGFPVYGAGPTDLTGWSASQAYGTLEYRMDHLADAELAVVRSYLTQLAAMETAIPGAGDNLDTDKAAVWMHNRDEVRDRMHLFDAWRTRLCGFLGVPPGPHFVTGSRLTVSMVV